MSLGIVFLGSGSFAVPCLEALLGSPHRVLAVITQPDRQKGRGRRVAPPPVKPVAAAAGLEVLQPERIRNPGFLPVLRELAPELLVVVAYGQILPATVLQVPPRGALNVHASLLPRHRGAAPIQWAIIEADAETGVTTMLLDEGMDTGPTLAARRLTIGPEETAGSLEARLAPLGASLLLDTLDGIEAGSLRSVPQDPERATRAPLLCKEDGRLDWTLTAHVLERRLRGLTPWPGGFTVHGGRRVKVLAASVADPAPGQAEPGSVITSDADGFVIACGEATGLRITQVQPESKRPMAASAFATGSRLSAGGRLG